MPKWLSAALIIAAAVLLTAGVIFYAVGRHHFGRDVMVADIEVMSTVAEITLPAGKNTGEDILAAAEALAEEMLLTISTVQLTNSRLSVRKSCTRCCLKRGEPIVFRRGVLI